MATNLNIEETWWTDPRREHLGRILRDVRLSELALADGIMVRVWHLAQTYYSNGRKLIPPNIWRSVDGHKAIEEAGLCEETPEGVRIRGVERINESLVNHREKAAALQAKHRALGSLGGKKTAESAIRDQSGRFLSKRNTVEVQAEVQAESKREPSDGPSLSISISKSISKKLKDYSVGKNELALALPETNLVKNSEKPKAAGNRGLSPEQVQRVRAFFGAYRKAYKSKFGDEAKPADLQDKKIEAQVINFAKDHPDIQRACDLVQVYFQMDEKWFKTKGYDFLTFRNNLAVIGQAADSGSSSGINWDFVFGKETAKGNT